MNTTRQESTPARLEARRYADERGYMEPLLEQNISGNLCVKRTESRKGVIRGFHWQRPPFDQLKYIFVLHGEIQDVIFPVLDGKPILREKVCATLKEGEGGLMVPANYAHGYQTLSEKSVVLYVCIGAYDPTHELVINPLGLSVEWLINPAIVSDKDLAGRIYDAN